MDLHITFNLTENAACALIAAPVLVACLWLFIRRPRKDPVIVEHR